MTLLSDDDLVEKADPFACFNEIPPTVPFPSGRGPEIMGNNITTIGEDKRSQVDFELLE